MTIVKKVTVRAQYEDTVLELLGYLDPYDKVTITFIPDEDPNGKYVMEFHPPQQVDEDSLFIEILEQETKPMP